MSATPEKGPRLSKSGLDARIEELCAMDPTILSPGEFLSILNRVKNRERTEGWNRAITVMAGPSQRLLDRIDQLEETVDADEQLDEARRCAVLSTLGLMRSKSADIRQKATERLAKIYKLSRGGAEKPGPKPIKESDLEV